ncbi:hypothetical protein Ancab_012067 [Ancistrocladus abbreviatus]
MAMGLMSFRGYVGDPPPAEGLPFHWQDRLFLDVYPQDIRNFKFWLEKPASFREVLEEYTEKMRAVTAMISKAMAKCLNLEEKCFLDEFGERASMHARFTCYPCSHYPNLVIRLKAHADGSGYTLILQDEVEGLQVFRNDCWLTVPTNPQALLMQIGDQMEIMSNATFKSPVHRVLCSAEREKTSIAVFYTPEKGKEIGPVDA